jgi:hypothetical protein
MRFPDGGFSTQWPLRAKSRRDWRRIFAENAPDDNVPRALRINAEHDAMQVYVLGMH